MPSQGFWGLREKGYLFSGIWGEGSFVFRDLGSRVLESREQGAEEKTFRELGRKVFFSFREQGAKTPPPGGASLIKRFAFLFSCTPVGRTSDSMTVLT